MKFAKPWQMAWAGHHEFVVTDAKGRKLFYIVGDEGDGDETEPSVLFFSNDADTDELLGEIRRLL